MGRAYSQDLRLRVLSALDGGMSKMAAHQTFQVSRSTIDDWLALRQEQGHVRDKARRRDGIAPALGALPEFAVFALAHQGQTLPQMAQAWEQETGQKKSINTFSLALKRLGWTRKKRVCSSKSAMLKNAKSSSGA